MAQVKLETKFVNDIAGKFFVPSYQRGYRWTEDEVTRLLEDVYNLKEAGSQTPRNYCLQPIVVKKLDENYFEVIDGQQRLTTLFLIYRCMYEAGGRFFGAPKFSLEYETRKQSDDFLVNINFDLKNDNIDFYFMTNAYETIENWFNTAGEISVVMPNIKTLFAERVKIIWYEVDETEDAVALFTRLNIGKIPLTNAELVKAIFLSNNHLNEYKQHEIALQWDNIEKELHNDALWCFLTNNSAEKYQTRIDLILDLMSEKNFDERETYFTFFKLAQEKDLNKTWEEIVHTFLILKDWYEDHERYHKIGYLIASGVKTLAEIYRESIGKTKRDFLSRVDEFIKDSIALKSYDDSYADWTYENNAEKIRRLLLLFNVESVRQNGERSQWFPFDKFKFCGEDKVSWSLEHIHAVKSQEKGILENWKEWLSLHLSSIKLLEGEDSPLVSEIENLLDKKEFRYNEFERLQSEIIKKFSPSGETETYIDTIENLALIKCRDNSALSNSTFDVKRNEVIRMDMQGAFIPFCTRMAFLKYYTKSEENQIHFWGKTDRQAYIEAINKVLEDYLTRPIVLRKEVWNGG